MAQTKGKCISTHVLCVFLNNQTENLINARTRVSSLIVMEFEYMDIYHDTWKEKMRAQFVY